MSERRHLPRDERQFIAETLAAMATSVVMRFDGELAKRSKGVAHLSEELTKDLLSAYRRLKKGSRS